MKTIKEGFKLAIDKLDEFGATEEVIQLSKLLSKLGWVENFNPETQIIPQIWDVGDVKSIAEDMEVVISEDEALEILHSAGSLLSDCTYAEWEIIREEVSDFLDNKKEK